MPQKRKDEEEKALVVPKSAQALIDDALNQVFDADPEHMQTVAEGLLDALDQKLAIEAYEPLKLALESLWSYAQAINGIIKGADYLHAVGLFERAGSGFHRLGQDGPRDLCIGMGAYAQAVLDVRQLNIAQARDRLKAVEEYLERAGRFSSKFKPLIHHMKPEMLFSAALPSLFQLDFPTARTLLEEASNAARSVAETYYSDGDPQKALFEGCAHLYQGFYNLVRSHSELQQFEYDRLAAEKQLVIDARSACELLAEAKEVSEPARVLFCLAESMVQLQEAIQEIAHIMKKVFEATFTPRLQQLRELSGKVRRASQSAAKAGPTAVAMVRYCEQIATQIKNIEHLGRPTKKDFGAYSGLVAAGIFLVLMPVVSWANANFQVNLGPKKLITSCMVLALIAGFGVGAVRFKTLVFPSRQGDGDSG